MESDCATADRERRSYYSVSSQCSQLPGIAPGQLSLKSWLICFKYDLFFYTHCWQSPLSPIRPSTTQSITRSYTVAWGSIY